MNQDGFVAKGTVVLGYINRHSVPVRDRFGIEVVFDDEIVGWKSETEERLKFVSLECCCPCLLETSLTYWFDNNCDGGHARANLCIVCFVAGSVRANRVGFFVRKRVGREFHFLLIIRRFTRPTPIVRARDGDFDYKGSPRKRFILWEENVVLEHIDREDIIDPFAHIFVNVCHARDSSGHVGIGPGEGRQKCQERWLDFHFLLVIRS